MSNTSLPPQPKPQREALLESAFLMPDLEICGRKLRPLSFGTLSLARKLDLTMFVDRLEEPEQPLEIPAIPLSILDQGWQITAFIWMQSAPLPEVLRAVKEGTWKDQVELLQFELDLDELLKFKGSIIETADQANVAAVSIQAKPGNDADKDAPGNS